MARRDGNARVHYDAKMASPRDLGTVVSIQAEAIGQPGQRRFRIRAMNRGGDTLTMWLEKEQLSAVGDAIETVLRDEAYEYERLPLDDLEPEPVFPLSATIEFQVLELSMGLDRENQLLILIGADDTAESDDRTAVSAGFDFRRAHELRRQIAEVVAAGRPACPLCTAPMDPAGHVCVRTNGHHPR